MLSFPMDATTSQFVNDLMTRLTAPQKKGLLAHLRSWETLRHMEMQDLNIPDAVLDTAHAGDHVNACKMLRRAFVELDITLAEAYKLLEPHFPKKKVESIPL